MKASRKAGRASHSPSRKSTTAAVVALAAVASGAHAHPEFNPTRTSRYIKLSLVGGGAVRVAYTVLIGEVPAAAQRKAADINGDGTIDAAEARGWADRLAADVKRGLAIDVDGAPAHLVWDAPVVGGLEDGRLGPYPFSVDLIAHVETGRGKHTVRYDDATPLPEVGDTEVRIEEGPGTALLGAWRARDDGKIQTRFAFTGPKFSVIEDRSIGFRFDDGQSPERRSHAVLPLGIAGGLLGAAAMAWWMVRRRRAGRRRA